MIEDIKKLVTEGHYGEALDQINVRYPQLDMDDLDDKVRILGYRIFIYLRTNKLKSAIETADEMYQFYDKIEKLSLKGLINHMYGLTQFKNKNYVKASDYLKKALFQAQESDDIGLEVRVLDTLGQYYRDYGDVSNAIYYFKRSEEKKMLMKDYEGLAITYGNIGRLYFTAGEFKKAREYFILDYELSKKLEDKFGQAIMLNHIGIVERFMDNIKKSETFYSKSYKLSEEMGYELSKGFSLAGLGYASYKKGGIEKARKYAESAIEIFREYKKKDGIIDATLLLAKIAIEDGKIEEAKSTLRRAEEISREENFYYEMSQSFLESAYLYFKIGEITKGLDRVEWFFETINKLSEDEETVYRYILNISDKLTGGDRSIILLKRDRSMELIRVDNSRGYEKINRKIVSYWKELENMLEKLDASAVNKKTGEWLRKNDFIEDEKILSSTLRRRGELFGVLISISGNNFRDDTDNLKSIFHSYSDKVSSSINKTLSIISSNYDILTRLKNRKSLNNDIKEEVFKSVIFENNMGIMIVDADNFKRVNNEYGHLRGDLFLVYLSNILKDLTSSDDILYRLGGDEFFLIRRDANRPVMENLAQNIIKQVDEGVRKLGIKKTNISASVGIYIHEDKRDRDIDFKSINPTEIMEKGDRALRSAKSSGKGTYFFYSDIRDR